MWIQLLTAAHLDLDGVQRTYRAGDWVDVGKQTALAMFVRGEARAASSERIAIQQGCGVAIVAGEPNRAGQRLSSLGLAAPSVPFGWTVPFERTLVWDPQRILPRPDLVLVGFEQLARWEVAAPLVSYDTLACDVGSESERRETAEIVHETRVPLYEPGMVFVRRCDATAALLERWQAERARGVEPRHALLRALYVSRPLLLALPTSWVAKRSA